MRLLDILFKKRKTNFLGRNGMFNCKGVSLTATEKDEVMIEPLTARGEIGQCFIEIPKEDLDDVIAFLEKQRPVKREIAGIENPITMKVVSETLSDGSVVFDLMIGKERFSCLDQNRAYSAAHDIGKIISSTTNEAVLMV